MVAAISSEAFRRVSSINDIYLGSVISGGTGGFRTPALVIPNDALSQLSNGPELRVFNATTVV